MSNSLGSRCGAGGGDELPVNGEPGELALGTNWGKVGLMSTAPLKRYGSVIGLLGR